MGTAANGRRRWSDDDLIMAVSRSQSMSQCIAALGLSARAAGNRTTVGRRIHALGLSTKHWTYEPGNRGPVHPLATILVEDSTYPTSRLRARLVAAGLMEAKCALCGLREWMGQPIPLEMDHRNGIATDHRLDNLRLLCPNCHAQTPTWRGRKLKKPPRTCVDCGLQVSKAATRCLPCDTRQKKASGARTKIIWPPADELAERVRASSYEAVGRSLGVTGAAVKKRLARDIVEAS